jgi:hypothetical protein
MELTIHIRITPFTAMEAGLLLFIKSMMGKWW